MNVKKRFSFLYGASLSAFVLSVIPKSHAVMQYLDKLALVSGVALTTFTICGILKDNDTVKQIIISLTSQRPIAPPGPEDGLFMEYCGYESQFFQIYGMLLNGHAVNYVNTPRRMMINYLDTVRTPLRVAFNNRCIHIFRLLLKYGADPEPEANMFYISLNMMSFGTNYANATKAVQFSDALIHHIKDAYLTYKAVLTRNNDGGLNYLISRKVPMDVCDMKTGDSLLHLRLTFDQMKLIVENGVDVNSKNKKGVSAFAMQCAYGNFDIVTYLINMGANVHEESYEVSPLVLAFTYRQYQLYKFLTTVCEIPMIKYYDSKCVICLDTLSEGFHLPCGHAYHEECILYWIRIHPFCPTCTQSF